ncbi:hypothetical protein ACFL5K_05645, partial [Gemmatimonadota bacterium]
INITVSLNILFLCFFENTRRIEMNGRLNIFFFLLVVSVFCQYGATNAGEIGFVIGGFSRPSEIYNLTPMTAWDNYEQEERMIGNDHFVKYSFMPGDNTSYKIKRRSWASSIGFTYIHKLFHPNFELEHLAGGAFGAEQSVQSHNLLYSANLNFVFPYYPRIALWRIKPFIGAGLGFAFLFGDDKNYTGLIRRDVPAKFQYADHLGNDFNIQYNFGCGGKIQIYEQWWLRISIRDYVFPSMLRLARPSISSLARSIEDSSLSLVPYPFTFRETTHNIKFNISIVYLD